MLNLMLDANAFSEWLLSPVRIAGLSLVILGIAIVLVAKKLTRVIKKQSQVDKDDPTYIKILTVGFVLILAGMVVCCF